MLHEDESTRDEGAWFAPKRFGYGASWPIAWQGWLALALYVGAMISTAVMTANSHGGKTAGLALMLLLTGLFMLIVARHTSGGWKWRWGGGD